MPHPSEARGSRVDRPFGQGFGPMPGPSSPGPSRKGSGAERRHGAYWGMATIRRHRAPAPAPARRALPDFSHLPVRVRAEEMVMTEPVTPAQDPEAGRDTDRDFMFRYGAG